MSTWLITGTSTGFGRALAEAVLERGDDAVVTARDVSTVEDLAKAYPEKALALALDVTDQTQIERVVREAEARFGGVDVLVNNAGYGYRGAVEEADDEDVRRLFATNFFGPVTLIQKVLPGMRERRRGAIVNVSSIGARITLPGSAHYSASKAALEGMSGSLRREVEPLGITVMAVEPGNFRTDFAGRSLTGAKTVIADYEPTVGPRRKGTDQSHGTQPGDPKKLAQALITVLESGRAPQLLVLGSDAVQNFEGVLESQRADLDAWRSVGTSTDL
ncbi:SDR family NAD(P)-dependent oxidoreductase [Actinoplanes sp. TBRC 11911]|uniref:oxidoreductase n=1 Tax=Actinoplanes sp. TBRC 11911 TaxID=2729386 RepID=UPI00145DEDFC|nr:oxidoreductase [Actinoplanes sp. TBRC 11911]NMO50665.1 SDR family NAD(P)-dependent oxidoreductase [Actinoplanes sp. TBRC 11911]